MSKINHYFKTYTQSNECFETSDGFLFHQKSDAVAHAATLKDKEVETHKRLSAELREIVKDTNEKNLVKMAEKNSGKGKSVKAPSGKGKKNTETAPADSGTAETATAENAGTSENPPADNSGAAE